MIPGMMIGSGLAAVLVNRINDRIFRHAMIAVIVVAGSATLIRELSAA
jgi:uncharacterized membrane protein YfcA